MTEQPDNPGICRQGFEAAWKQGVRPDLDDFLIAGVAREPLLAELIPIDLRRRWESAKGPTARPPTLLADYLVRYPTLGELPELLLPLLAAEFRLRLEHGEREIDGEYLEAFPDHAEALAPLLASLKRERREQQELAATHDFGAAETQQQSPRHPPSSAAPSNDARDPSDARDPRDGAMDKRPPHELPTTVGDDSLSTRADSLTQPTAAGPAGNAPAGNAPADLSLPRIPGYCSEAFIAKGGMGFVIRARHEVLGRVVAIKLPLPSAMEKPTARTRFMREARAAANLTHPQICPIHEVGETEAGPYIVMGFIAGLPLDEWASQEQPNGRRAAELMAQLTRAVHYAHEHGVLHRDIKPANVMLETETGLPVLMDFGLAKETSSLDSLETQAGQVMGTPSFMAPEQADGRVEDIGPHTDVYSLGSLLYYLLCGRPPFEGSLGAVLRQVQTEAPPGVRALAPQVHRDLETICNKAMAKSPRERYASAAELADDLERFGAGEAILARPLTRIQKLGRSIRRRPVAWLGGLAAAAAIALSVTLAQWALRAAGQAAGDRQLNELITQLESSAATGDWGPAHLESLDHAVQELEAISSEQAALWRKRVTQGLIQSLESDLRQPRLDDEQLAQVEARLAAVARRDPAAHAHWEQELSSRVARWEELFSVAGDDDAEAVERTLPRNVLAVDGLLRCSSALAVCAQSSQGRVELEAEFVGPWQSEPVGLILGYSPGQPAYRFMIRRRVLPVEEAAQSANQTAKSQTANAQTANQIAPRPAAGTAGSDDAAPGELEDSDWPLELVAMRDRRTLKRWALRGDLPADRLTLRVRREGEEFQLWINQDQRYQFLDLFPIRQDSQGRFAVAPGAAGLAVVRAARRRLPLSPSPLEEADELLLQGDPRGALAAYSRLEASGIDAQRRTEVAVKRGLCLLETGRLEEAETTLSAALLDDGPRWPIVAGCQLWRHFLESQQDDKADRLVDLLGDRFSFRDLGAAVPESLRADLIRRYRRVLNESLFEANPRLVEELERAAKVESMLGQQDEQVSSMYLLQAYSRLGQLDKAAELGRRQADRGNYLAAVEYLDVLCVLGDLPFALSEWERLPAPPTFAKWQLARARILGGLQRWAEAKEIVDRALAEESQDASVYARAAALDGVALTEMGHPLEAEQAWQRHIEEHRRRYANQFHRADGGFSTMHFHFLILGGLAGALSTDELAYIMRGVAGADIAQAARAMMNEQALQAAMHRGWRSERGRQRAFELVLDRVPASERMSSAMLVGGYGFLLPRLFGNHPPGPEQDALLWESCHQLVQLMHSKQLKLPQMLLLAAALKGQTGLLGWSGVAHTLPPDLRARLAYLLAQRAIAKGEVDTINPRLEEAIEHGPPKSRVARLAQEDLLMHQAAAGRLVVINRTGHPWTLRITDDQGAVTELPVASAAAEEGRDDAGHTSAAINLTPGTHRIERLAGAALSAASLDLTPGRRQLVTIDDVPWRAAARRFIDLGASVVVLWHDDVKRTFRAGDELPISAAARLLEVHASYLKQPTTDRDLAALRRCSGLDRVSIEGDSYCSLWGLRHLEASRGGLRQLAIGARLDRDTCEFLAQFPSLMRLSCSHSDFEPGRPPRGPRLQSLGISPAQFAAWREPLREFDQLYEVNLYSPDPAADLEGLNTLARVERFSVSSFLEARQLPPRARRVGFTYRNIEPRQVEQLRDPRIEWIEINGELAPGVGQRLSELPHVSALALRGDKIPREEAAAIAALRDDWHVTLNNELLAAPDHRELVEQAFQLGGRIWISSHNWKIARSLAEIPSGPITIGGLELQNQQNAEEVDRLLAAFDKSPLFNNLALVNCKFTPERLLTLLRDSNVSYLNLRQSDVDDSLLLQLPSLPTLNTVDLRKTRITAAAMAQWRPSHVRHLLIDAAQFDESLREWPCLQGLTIEQPDVATLRLAATLPLRELQIVGGDVELDDAFAELPRSLAKLSLAYGRAPLTADRLRKLSDLPEIRLELLHSPLGDDWAEGVAALTNVIHLKLNQAGLDESDEGIQALRAARPDMILTTK